MQKIYTLDELIKASKDKLNIHIIRDYCRRGELNPCIFFEGNLVCIKEERNTDKNNSYEPVVHIETVSWSKVFKGYVSAANFIDYITPSPLDSAGAFYNVDKVLEQMSPTSPLPDLQPDEYLKAFPRRIDDDIQEKRWLREIKDFQGNIFRADEIFFHASEVDEILSTTKPNDPIKFIDHSNKDYLTSIFKDEAFTLIQAACIISGDDPEIIDLIKNKNLESYKSKYPENCKALNTITRAIEVNLLPAKNGLIQYLYLKEFLVNRGYIIKGFSESSYTGRHVKYMFPGPDGKIRDIPKVTDYNVKNDPLSDENYFNFKIKQLSEENFYLSQQLKEENNRNTLLSSEISTLKSQIDSIPQDELAGLQLKNQIDKDRQGMMRIIAIHLWQLDENKEKSPHEIAKMVRKEMSFYCEDSQLPQTVETIKRYISAIAPDHLKKPGRRPLKN